MRDFRQHIDPLDGGVNNDATLEEILLSLSEASPADGGDHPALSCGSRMGDRAGTWYRLVGTVWQARSYER